MDEKQTLYPESALLTSTFIPYYFEPKKVSTIDSTLIKDDNYTIEQDVNGLSSIISVRDIPYIDISKYDHLRKRFFWTDQFDNRWRVFLPGDWIEQEQSFWPEDFTYNVYQSIEGLLDGDLWTVTSLKLEDFNIQQFRPISVRVNGVELEDVSNYAGDRNIIPKLDNIDPSTNKQFYYDMKNTIYTNQDFDLFEDDNIEITYFKNIDSVQIYGRLNTNVTNLSSYTPVVDYYIIKLSSQNL